MNARKSLYTIGKGGAANVKNVKFVAKDRYLVTEFLTLTDIQEENGMPIFSQLGLKKMVKSERLTFVPDVSGQTRLPVPTNFVWTCCTFLVQFFIA